MSQEQVKGLGKSSSVESRYEKAEKKARAIDLVEQKGVPVEEAFLKYGFKISRYSYPRILSRYKSHGVDGLIDTRGGARSTKVSDDIRKFIVSLKSEREDLTAAQICETVEKRFSVSIHFAHMSRILHDLGLNNPVGRPAREEFIEQRGIDHAGCFIMKAACLAMGLPDRIVDLIVARIKEIKSGHSEYSREFLNMRILSSSAEVIRRKIETLLFMPVFGMERIWHFKTVYPRKGLGLVTGSSAPYKYHTMDNFLRELPLLDIDQSLSKALARLYVETFYINFRTKDARTFYIDCFRKVVWTKKNIPKGMHATRNQILKCVDIYFIHDSQGRPLLPLTRPGDSHLTDALFPLIDALEEAIGEKVVDFAIFDREGLAVAVFKEFQNRKRHYITILRENQYRSIDDFEIAKGRRWKTYKKDIATGRALEQVLDCNKTLVDSKTKQTYKTRSILVRDAGSESFAVIVTNISRKTEPDATKIVDKYKDRWDRQENSFKQMKPSLYLDTNHGTNAIEQSHNRVIERRVENLEKGIQAQEKKMESTENKIRKTVQILKQLGERIETGGGNRENTERHERKIIRREKLKTALSQYSDALGGYRSKSQLLANKLESIDQTKVLYEIDSRKDNIMTNLETALNNADIFVKERYLPEDYSRSDFRTIRDILYRQQGTCVETKEEVKVILDYYDQEPEHQRLAAWAVEKINAAQLRTGGGKRLVLRVATA
ncbi:MAG: helix-turn-helix domain-containing protein [Planctomycetes bacterium]|nr:helix-turn-helix domain-containing protein [Planctomycetota bacterium]